LPMRAVVHQTFDEAQKARRFAAPGMVLINRLAEFDGPGNFAGMQKCVSDLFGQVLFVAELEEEQVARAEIVLNPWSRRSDDGFALREVFENASRRIQLSKDAAAVWDDSEIAFSNGL